MRSLLALALTIAGVVSATIMNMEDYKFIKYIVKFNKEYNTIEEFNMRKLNFLLTDAEIARLNARVNATSVHGHNHFSDLSDTEFKSRIGLKDIRLPDRTDSFNEDVSFASVLPDNIDWVAKGKVNPVKDQGDCKSCYAFAAIAAMESAHAISYSSLPNLSDQQLTSCTGDGCAEGGDVFESWDYAKTTPVTSNAIYPYTSNKGVTGKCNYVKGIIKVIRYTLLDSTTNAIRAAVAKQPVACSIALDLK